MFHHFHDKNHVKGQGSIDATEFSNIIKFYSNNFNILSAEIFLKKFFNDGLDKNDVCITFDDNLKCQYDVALPILNELKIKEGKPMVYFLIVPIIFIPEFLLRK